MMKTNIQFSDYLHFLHGYVGSDKTQADFVLYITDLFMKEPQSKIENDEDDSDRYNPLSKNKKKTLERIYTNENGHKLSKTAARKLRAKFQSDKFIDECKLMSKEVKKRMISDLKSFGINANTNSCFQTAADTYFCFLDNLSNGIDSINKNILETERSAKKKTEINNIKQTITDEKDMIVARSFCKKHEAELSLLPLCLVADNINPLHSHVRKMFDEFSLCSNSVKKSICELAGVGWTNIKESWLYPCIRLYQEDIKTYDLGDCDFLYDGAKYLQSSLSFSGDMINNVDPSIFTLSYNDTEHLCTITSYINWYLYTSDSHDAVKKPINMVWDEVDLYHCSLKEMSFWVMRMIISTIYQMPLGIYDDYRFIEEHYIETYEDMYYYALLVLYTRYGKHI